MYSGRWSRRLARQLRLLPHRIDRLTIARAREPRIRRRREQRARSFLGGAEALAVEGCEVGPTEPGVPSLFDVWVRPAGAELAYTDPSAALVLVGPRHRRARRAWERGTIAGSPVAFASYLVPAPVWTPTSPRRRCVAGPVASTAARTSRSPPRCSDPTGPSRCTSPSSPGSGTSRRSSTAGSC